MWIWCQIDMEFLGSRRLTMPPRLQEDIEGMSFSETAHFFRETFQLAESEEEIKAVIKTVCLRRYSASSMIRTAAPISP